jgi:hypothetical protein
MSKNCQKVLKKLSKVVKKLSKSCQKVVKVVKKIYKFKTSGEDDEEDEEEEEEDWWLQDQVATSSHLVKTIDILCNFRPLGRKMQKCSSFNIALKSILRSFFSCFRLH